MRFANPEWLWLLVGVPILIIIYLIRSRHEDRPVSSTFIWKLSDKFAKKRLPIQRLRKFLLFLLQLLMIIVISLMASKPMLKEGQTYDYIIVLDSSASMQLEDEKGVSRFERAKEKIYTLAGDLRSGHTVTVILAGREASYLTRQTTSAGELKLALNGVLCSNGTSDVSAAIALAQEMCDRTENAKVVFFTDKDFKEAGNIEVVDLRQDEWNVSLEGLTSKKRIEYTQFTGYLTSYNKDVTLTVGLKIDGTTSYVSTVSCEKDVQTKVEFVTDEPIEFERAEIYIDAKDAFLGDNSFGLCQQNRKKHNVLLVSAAPLYIKSALDSMGNCNVTVNYELDQSALSGYDLYIFDGITPKEYPEDASVIVFGTENLPSGIRTEVKYDLKNTLTMDTKSESGILSGVELKGTVVNGYSPLISNSTWESLLYCRGNTVLATTETQNGTRISVFSFDLHNSNLPLQSSFLVLMKNLVDYSVDSMFSKTHFTAGETVGITILRGCENIYAEFPSGIIKSLSIQGDEASLTVYDVGMYTVLMTGETLKEYADIYVGFPEDEFSNVQGGLIAVTLTEQIEKEEAFSDGWFWFALAILIILLLEWGVYYYEQY